MPTPWKAASEIFTASALKTDAARLVSVGKVAELRGGDCRSEGRQFAASRCRSAGFASGFDPIYFGKAQVNAAVCDTVSTTRPIFVPHFRGNLSKVKRHLMDMAGVTAYANGCGELRHDSQFQ